MKNEDSQIKDYKTMKKIINTLKAPQPIGPYSQAVLVGDVLYTSGQISLNPETGKLVKDSIDIETVQVMENLKAVLQAANMTFKNVIKSTIFISDMKNFGAINNVYGKYFDDSTAPARETVEVANLPKFVNVEISMIASL
jgi:2-iminobutanoate/2-iminopropanoate deaminase|tara:strand:+ start:2671 stop:3090 length:420 start_codon:yes stop_codon:yes gene_type:complete